MSTRRAINAINWTAIAERVSESEKPMFAAFRTKSDLFLRRVQAFPENAPQIDWAMYKKNIPIPGMVDNFQKSYEALKIPYPPDNYSSIVDEQEKDAAAHVQKYVTESNTRIKEYEAELERIAAMIPFDQMTMEDAAEAYPEIAWNPEKPTLWPHLPEYQPGDEPEPIPEPEH